MALCHQDVLDYLCGLSSLRLYFLRNQIYLIFKEAESLDSYIGDESGTKVLAYQLSLDRRAKRSG